MHCLTLAPPRRSFPASRLAWGVAAAARIAGVVAAVPGEGVPWRAVLSVGLAPDLPLLVGGFAPGNVHGSIAPWSVPFYNALHRAWAPAPLAFLALAGVVGHGWLAAALAWGAHIAFDRLLGYGLRGSGGAQRG